MDPRDSVRALQGHLASARRLCTAGHRHHALAAVDAALRIDPRCLAAQSLRETILRVPDSAKPPASERRPAATDDRTFGVVTNRAVLWAVGTPGDVDAGLPVPIPVALSDFPSETHDPLEGVALDAQPAIGHVIESGRNSEARASFDPAPGRRPPGLIDETPATIDRARRHASSGASSFLPQNYAAVSVNPTPWARGSQAVDRRREGLATFLVALLVATAVGAVAWIGWPWRSLPSDARSTVSFTAPTEPIDRSSTMNLPEPIHLPAGVDRGDATTEPLSRNKEPISNDDAKIRSVGPIPIAPQGEPATAGNVAPPVVQAGPASQVASPDAFFSSEAQLAAANQSPTVVGFTAQFPPETVPATPEGLVPSAAAAALPPASQAVPSALPPEDTPANAGPAALVAANRVVADPAAPLDAASAPEPALDDERLVSIVLERYRTAYDRLDARSAKAVWPTVDEAALSRAFSGLTSQALQFESCGVRVRGGTASATCRGVARYVTRTGAREPRTERRIWSFTLQKRAANWTIASARANSQEGD